MSQLNSWLSSRLQNSVRSYWKRCWRGSVNGWHTQTFHQLCDDLGPTVTIVRAYGYIYGGYTDRSWKCTYHYSITFSNFLFNYLALINRAGGLYGRILTEVVSTDLTAFGLYSRPKSRFSHTDRLSSVNKMFIIWQTRTFDITGLY